MRTGKDICSDYRMIDGTLWPIPITLSTDEDVKAGDEIALFSDKYNEIMATMKVKDVYKIDKEYECKEVFKTTDMEHPRCVKMVMNQAGKNLAVQ